MKIYRANILFTPTPEQFKVLEHGYVVVGDDGGQFVFTGGEDDEHLNI